MVHKKIIELRGHHYDFEIGKIYSAKEIKEALRREKIIIKYSKK